MDKIKLNFDEITDCVFDVVNKIISLHYKNLCIKDKPIDYVDKWLCAAIGLLDYLHTLIYYKDTWENLSTKQFSIFILAKVLHPLQMEAFYEYGSDWKCAIGIREKYDMYNSTSQNP